MTELTIELNPASEVVERAIVHGLRFYNERVVGPPNPKPFAIFVRNEHGEAIGGLDGQLRWGWLYVNLLWLPEERRGRGLGARLMVAAESWAVEQGCTGSYLETFAFQALPFYERLGYQIYGTLEGFPAGSRRYSLCKVLPVPLPASTA